MVEPKFLDIDISVGEFKHGRIQIAFRNDKTKHKHTTYMFSLDTCLHVWPAVVMEIERAA